jgi:hypothetical protein
MSYGIAFTPRHTPIEIACRQCGQRFLRQVRLQVYCSQRCKRERSNLLAKRRDRARKARLARG